MNNQNNANSLKTIGNEGKGFAVNTFFKGELGEALLRCQKDLRLPQTQDVIRLACSSFLIKSGYLKTSK